MGLIFLARYTGSPNSNKWLLKWYPPN
jgi:hypothetical protein